MTDVRRPLPAYMQPMTLTPLAELVQTVERAMSSLASREMVEAPEMLDLLLDVHGLAIRATDVQRRLFQMWRDAADVAWPPDETEMTDEPYRPSWTMVSKRVVYLALDDADVFAECHGRDLWWVSRFELDRDDGERLGHHFTREDLRRLADDLAPAE